MSGGVPASVDPAGHGLFADAVPLDGLFGRLFDRQGRVLASEVQAQARSHPLDCGLLIDSQIAVTDKADTPPVPFPEFPRLAALDADTYDVVLAAAERHLTLHGLQVPVTMAELPEIPPSSVHAVVSEMRSMTSAVTVLRGLHHNEMYVVRTVGSEADVAPVTVMAASVVDPADDHFGLSNVRIGLRERAGLQAARLVESRGVVAARSWRRRSGRWEPTTAVIEVSEPSLAAELVHPAG